MFLLYVYPHLPVEDVLQQPLPVVSLNRFHEFNGGLHTFINHTQPRQRVQDLKNITLIIDGEPETLPPRLLLP